MTPEQNLTIANTYIAALSARAGPEDLDAFFAPDFMQEEFPNPLMPNGATRDLQSMKQARARGKALLSAEHFEIFGALASGNHVAIEAVWTGTVGIAAGPFVAGQELRAQFAIFLNSETVASCGSTTMTVSIRGKRPNKRYSRRRPAIMSRRG